MEADKEKNKPYIARLKPGIRGEGTPSALKFSFVGKRKKGKAAATAAAGAKAPAPGSKVQIRNLVLENPRTKQFWDLDGTKATLEQEGEQGWVVLISSGF